MIILSSLLYGYYYYYLYNNRELNIHSVVSHKIVLIVKIKITFSFDKASISTPSGVIDFFCTNRFSPCLAN